MINTDLKIEKKEAQEFEPLPENVYQVELLDVNSSENETYDSKQGKTDGKQYETVFEFQYTLLAGKDKKGEDLRGRNIWDNFIPAYLYISRKTGKNKLYRIIESLLGREIEPEEEASGIDAKILNSLIGKQMRVATENIEKNQKVFTKIKTYYVADTLLKALTDEEKEKATVKNKKENKVEHSDDEINPEDIPFN
jgi:hypothetical protein